MLSFPHILSVRAIILHEVQHCTCDIWFLLSNLQKSLDKLENIIFLPKKQKVPLRAVKSIFLKRFKGWSITQLNVMCIVVLCKIIALMDKLCGKERKIPMMGQNYTFKIYFPYSSILGSNLKANKNSN